MRARQAFSQISGVSGNLIGNYPGLHVVAVGQAEVFLGRHVAQHRAAEPTDHRRADSAGDVIVARRDIGGQRTKRVEGRLVATLQLLVHVLFDLVHGHVARTFDHHLTVLGPSDLGQLAQGFQLGKLRFVVGVRNRTGTQTIAK